MPTTPDALWKASVATIQESLRRFCWFSCFATNCASVATIQESLRRSTHLELLQALNGISRHDSGELEAALWSSLKEDCHLASVATIQESLRRGNKTGDCYQKAGISRHDSGELEAELGLGWRLSQRSHQSPRFRRA